MMLVDDTEDTICILVCRPPPRRVAFVASRTIAKNIETRFTRHCDGARASIILKGVQEAARLPLPKCLSIKGAQNSSGGQSAGRHWPMELQ
jgi:hypothetical protein